MKVAAVLVCAALALGILWIAGEQHRENCQRDGHVNCSVLPWDNGEVATRDRPYTAEECALLREAAAQPFSEVKVPAQCR